MRIEPRRRWFAVLATMVLAVAAACGGEDGSAGGQPDSPSPTESESSVPDEPRGAPLSAAAIQQLAAQFADSPLTGGQTAPRFYRWVNDTVAIFLQFDDSDLATATELRYVGVSVKGVFCAENQPGGEKGGFPHFHRLDAADYAEGHGGPAGTPGYWLSWVAVADFTARDGRTIEPGVDYKFSPTPPPPSCGTDAPRPDFTGPGAGSLSGTRSPSWGSCSPTSR